VEKKRLRMLWKEEEELKKEFDRKYSKRVKATAHKICIYDTKRISEEIFEKIFVSMEIKQNSSSPSEFQSHTTLIRYTCYPHIFVPTNISLFISLIRSMRLHAVDRREGVWLMAAVLVIVLIIFIVREREILLSSCE
jgi:hypothetical protein